MTTLARIVAAFGGTLYDAGRRALIPGPGHARDDRSVSLFDPGDGRILIHCFSPRDDWRTARDMLARAGFLDARAPAGTPAAATAARTAVAQPTVEDRVARARRIWGQGVALPGTLAARYLAARGVAIQTGVADCGALRFHRAMTALDDRRRRPALLSAIRAHDGRVQGVEATLLAHRGARVGKAAVATPRRVIGRLLDGAVRLAPPGAALIVAEGVETALSAAHALDGPAWAMLSAANLARFDPPPQVRALIVAADADPTGMGAAQSLAARLRGALERVEIIAPPYGFNDWNDHARALIAGRPLDRSG